MATHQSLSGSTDEEFVERMATTYPERFGEPFWAFFTKEVAPALPADFMAVDLGCGPGLFLHDLASRYPQAALHGNTGKLTLLNLGGSLATAEADRPIGHPLF